MDGLAWDLTKAAGSHAALAGVLATLAIAMLTILATRPSGRNTQTLSLVDWVHVQRVLVVATFLMLISAIIWGTIAGEPSMEAISRAWNDGPAPRNEIEALLVRAWLNGAAAVIVLGVGSLALISSMLTLVNHDSIPRRRPGDSTDTRRATEIDGAAKEGAHNSAAFISAAFALLTILGTYEIAFFATTVQARRGLVDGSRVNEISLGLALGVGILGLLGLIRGLSRRVLRWTMGSRSGRWVRGIQMGLACAAGLLATAGYALTPSGYLYNNREDFGQWDEASVACVLTAAGIAMVFMFTTAWLLAAPSAQAREGEGNSAEGKSESFPPSNAASSKKAVPSESADVDAESRKASDRQPDTR